MNKIENAIKAGWVLCHNSIDIFHIVELSIGSNIETGQPFLEIFETETELEKRLIELTNNPNWYSEYKINLVIQNS